MSVSLDNSDLPVPRGEDVSGGAPALSRSQLRLLHSLTDILNSRRSSLSDNSTTLSSLWLWLRQVLGCAHCRRSIVSPTRSRTPRLVICLAVAVQCAIQIAFILYDLTVIHSFESDYRHLLKNATDHYITKLSRPAAGNGTTPTPHNAELERLHDQHMRYRTQKYVAFAIVALLLSLLGSTAALFNGYKTRQHRLFWPFLFSGLPIIACHVIYVIVFEYDAATLQTYVEVSATITIMLIFANLFRIVYIHYQHIRSGITLDMVRELAAAIASVSESVSPVVIQFHPPPYEKEPPSYDKVIRLIACPAYSDVTVLVNNRAGEAGDAGGDTGEEQGEPLPQIVVSLDGEELGAPPGYRTNPNTPTAVFTFHPLSSSSASHHHHQAPGADSNHNMQPQRQRRRSRGSRDNSFTLLQVVSEEGAGAGAELNEASAEALVNLLNTALSEQRQRRRSTENRPDNSAAVTAQDTSVSGQDGHSPASHEHHDHDDHNSRGTQRSRLHVRRGANNSLKLKIENAQNRPSADQSSSEAESTDPIETMASSDRCSRQCVSGASELLSDRQPTPADAGDIAVKDTHPLHDHSFEPSLQTVIELEEVQESSL